ncbi:hypothetical protein ACK129_20425 [Pseudomonas citrulli]|uniref:hypothetical protein n=1 Tax=Pseudomonas citrulli TaxID=3064347 RepID=UPI003AC8AF79
MIDKRITAAKKFYQANEIYHMNKNQLPTAVIEYKKKVDICVAKINRIIAAHATVKREIEVYKAQMINIKKTIKEPTNQRDSQYLFNQISFLENSALALTDIADAALLSTIGRLGLNLDELRLINQSMQKTTTQDANVTESKLITYTLAQCQQDVDDTCRRLINCCELDASILKIMGMTENQKKSF